MKKSHVLSLSRVCICLLSLVAFSLAVQAEAQAGVGLTNPGHDWQILHGTVSIQVQAQGAAPNTEYTVSAYFGESEEGVGGGTLTTDGNGNWGPGEVATWDTTNRGDDTYNFYAKYIRLGVDPPPANEDGSYTVTIANTYPAWEPPDVNGNGIQCSGITAPSDGALYASLPSAFDVPCSIAEATDTDHRYAHSGNPQDTYPSDTVSYGWWASAGSWKNGSTGRNVTWVCPANYTGNVTIKCTVSDTANTSGENGSRDDDNLLFTVVISVDNWTLELAADPSALPRDGNSESTITATVKKNGVAQAGKTVNFTSSSQALPASGQGVTNSQGQCTFNVHSSDTGTSPSLATIFAAVAGVANCSAQTDVTFRGLSMSLTTQYNKIYIANASWRKDTVLTCTVKDSADTPAQGAVTFQTGSGSFTGPNPAQLNGAGVAYVTLNPGNAAYTDTAYSVLGSVNANVQVVFADHTYTASEINPHKKTTEQAYAQAKLRDQDNQPFPGADVTFSWEVPNNQEDDDVVTTATGTPPPDQWVTSQGPSPTVAGWGTIQITTARLADPQCDLRFTIPAEWTVEYLEGQGATIETHYESNGIKFSVTLDPDLKFAVTATKTF